MTIIINKVVPFFIMAYLIFHHKKFLFNKSLRSLNQFAAEYYKPFESQY